MKKSIVLATAVASVLTNGIAAVGSLSPNMDAVRFTISFTQDFQL